MNRNFPSKTKEHRHMPELCVEPCTGLCAKMQTEMRTEMETKAGAGVSW
jgi:hypothetical protein